MTSTFPMNAPTSRAALKWLSSQLDKPFLTEILKADILFFRFEREEKDRLVIGVRNELAINVMARNERQISDILTRGYASQGNLELKEIVLECE